MQPQSPRPNLIANLKVLEDVAVQIRIRREKLLECRLLVPSHGFQITSLTWEEAVVTQQLATFARRQDNLIVCVIPAPVLDSTVDRVVDQPQLDCLGGIDVGV